MKNRREFLQHSAVTVCAACGLIGGCSSSDGGTPPSSGTEITLDSADTTTLSANSSTLALTSSDYSGISGEMLVCRDSSGTLRAFSGTCPHAASTLSFVSGSDSIECKIATGGHGALFNFQGSCTSGPSGGSTNYTLTSYTVSESGGTITITT